jgi:hypothetical protein
MLLMLMLLVLMMLTATMTTMSPGKTACEEDRREGGGDVVYCEVSCSWQLQPLPIPC